MSRSAMIHVYLSAVMLVACSGSPDTSLHTFELREDDGVTIAHTKGGPGFKGELFEYERVLELRGDPDDPESLLYRPVGAVRASDGSYLVADSGNHRIAVFDATGRFVRSFGRAGEGPGEFQWMVELRMYDDQLLVRDAMLRRTYAFRLDGLLLDSVTNPLPFFSRIPTVWRTPDGNLVVITTIDERRSIETGIQQNAAVVQTSEGDTLSVVYGHRVRTSHRYPAGPGMLSAPVYFSGVSLCRYYQGRGIVVTGGEEPIVEWYALDGRLTHRFVIDLPREPISAEDRSEILDFLDRQVSNARAGAPEGGERLRPEMAIGLRNHAQFAESKAFWDMIMVDADGYIWLQIPYADGSLRPRPPREKQRLLSPLGEYLGITEWPAVDRVTWIGDGYLLSIVVEEETGLEVPTVFRIRPVIEGLEYPVSQGAAVPGH